MTIYLDEHIFEVNHHTNKRIKRVSIVLENKSQITIKTPLKFKAHNIKEVIYSYKEWILKSINKVQVKNTFDFVCGSTIPLFGKQYPLELVSDEKIKNIKVQLKNDIFYFRHNPSIIEYDLFLDALKKYYKKVVASYIDPLFDEICFKTKLYPNNIGYRYAKRRWGSCSYKNDISMNYMLLQFPKEAIEYVVLHELCHIEEKNHSKRFYNLVSLYMPDYKMQEEVLKKKSF